MPEIRIYDDQRYTITFNDGTVRKNTAGSSVRRFMSCPTRANTIKKIKWIGPR